MSPARLGLLAAALTAAACGAQPSARGARTGECSWSDVPGARCVTVTVPENPSSPTGASLSLRVVVLPATGGRPRPDPVFVLAGGPGQAATVLARGMAASRLRDERDLVFADQRGTGGSGDLQCGFYRSREGRLDDFIPAASVPACRDALQQSADLRQYTTAASVADLEAVRLALGFASINLVGGSYGTRLAMEYVRAHPGRVRSVVLEGPVPTTMRVPEGFGQSAQRALDGLLEECAADEACGRAYPAIREEARAVFDRLRRGPVRTTVNGREVEMTRDHVAEALRYMLYSSHEASRVPAILHAAHGGDFSALAAFLLNWRRTGTFDAIYLSITCTEDVPFVAPEAAARDEGTFLGTYRIEQQRAACEAWPRGTAPAWRDTPVAADVPVLIFSGALDPVTPPDRGAELARTLPNSLHLSVPAGGHSWRGLAGADCVERLEHAFIARASAHGLDTSCVSAIRRRGFASD